MQKDKSIFKLEGLPVDRFAEALGLPGTPKIKFLSRELAKQKKNAFRETQVALEASSEDEPDHSESEAEQSNDEEDAGREDSKTTNVGSKRTAISLPTTNVCSRL